MRFVAQSLFFTGILETLFNDIKVSVRVWQETLKKGKEGKGR